mmetsp:Transcript_11228/g.15795  ORF Transcript_11228/g.15795 Transcript_11228/m.15795 type:complete len:81 (-) Transcript_11228:203-445(-)
MVFMTQTYIRTDPYLEFLVLKIEKIEKQQLVEILYLSLEKCGVLWEDDLERTKSILSWKQFGILVGHESVVIQKSGLFLG